MQVLVYSARLIDCNHNFWEEGQKGQSNDQLHPLFACGDYDVTGGKDVIRRGSDTCTCSVEPTHHHPIVTRADIRGVLAN
jgi:hypothetical protein